MIMKAIFVSFLVIVQFCSYRSNAVIVSVDAVEPVITQPRSSFEDVSSLTILTCTVRPSNASFISRWITPSGEILSRSTGRYSINQGLISAEDQGTILAVESLSYEDAGVYTCEVVPRGGSVLSCDCNDFPASASIQLILQVYLQVFAEEITVIERTTVFLHCEMSGYILPDEDILWFEGEDIIRPGGRYSISYSNGTSYSAQNGGVSVSSSRVSTLEIAATVVSDTGVYLCRVRDREIFKNVTLSVEEDATTFHTPGEEVEQTGAPVSEYMGTTTTFNDGIQADNPPPLENGDDMVAMSECKLEQSRLIGITFVATFLVTVGVCVLLMVIIVTCLCVKLQQQKGALLSKTTMLGTASEDEKVLSAVNMHACVLDEFSVENIN